MHPKFLARMQELRDLSGIIGLATWDQETYLPRKAETGRAAQLGTLQALYHERLSDPHLGDWLAQAEVNGSDEAAMVRVLRIERDRAVKVPSALVKALAEAQSHGLSAWREAREREDYSLFEPMLQRLLSLRREMADAWGHQGERYDALLEGYEPGMRVERLSPVLSDLRRKLVPLVQAIDAQSPPRRLFEGAAFAVDAQWNFTLELLQAMGFDLDAGRQDKSTHPFTGGTGLFDVRLTTRVFPELPLSSVFSTIHEGGHGLYEQGFAKEHARTTLAQAPSMGLHESQSRLWENIIGRSRHFWEHFYPKYQRHFPQLGQTSLDDFYREVNRFERSLIRVEADEVTYNLHIILRYELELQLLRGSLEARDLEAAWNEQVKALLGLQVTSPRQGVLQDIHWAWGEFGYFPTYALGNLYSASLWKALERDVGGLSSLITQGELMPIKQWLGEKIHRQGFRFEAEALVTQITGRGLTDDDFVAYLKEKYSALYSLTSLG